jgi:hypothetical protein
MAHAQGFDALLGHVCVELGFCGSVVDGEPCHVTMLIPVEGPFTADDFVALVFEAEGSVLETHRQPLRAAFIRYMGSEVVDARSLK